MTFVGVIAGDLRQSRAGNVEDLVARLLHPARDGTLGDGAERHHRSRSMAVGLPSVGLFENPRMHAAQQDVVGCFHLVAHVVAVLGVIDAEHTEMAPPDTSAGRRTGRRTVDADRAERGADLIFDLLEIVRVDQEATGQGLRDLIHESHLPAVAFRSLYDQRCIILATSATLHGTAAGSSRSLLRGCSGPGVSHEHPAASNDTHACRHRLGSPKAQFEASRILIANTSVSPGWIPAPG